MADNLQIDFGPLALVSVVAVFLSSFKLTEEKNQPRHLALYVQLLCRFFVLGWLLFCFQVTYVTQAIYMHSVSVVVYSVSTYFMTNNEKKTATTTTTKAAAPK